MRDLIPPDSVFTCLVFGGVATEFPGGMVRLGEGLSVHDSFPLDTLDAHWEGRLGKNLSERIEECRFAILAVAPSALLPRLAERKRTPCELAAALLTSIYAQGPFDYSGQITHMQGARQGEGDTWINTVGWVAKYYRTCGAPARGLCADAVLRAMKLADGICRLHEEFPRYRRLRAATHALRRAFEERQPYDCIHQLVRAIEGFTKGSSARKFAKRCARLIEGPEQTFRDIYRMRNEVEHLDDLLQDFAGSDGQRERQGRLRTWQAERVAATLFTEIVGDSTRRACFADDEDISSFWSGTAAWKPEQLARLADLDAGFDDPPSP